MSMTLALKPQSQIMGEWVKIFPRQVTESYTRSIAFMKELTVVAISTITYLKNLLPEDSFNAEYFGGVRLHILKKNCEHELAQFVTSALTDAFDAFDKQYLHQMALCFYDGDCDEQNLIEYHIFEYSYRSDGMSMNVQSKSQNNVEHSARYSFDDTRERTVHMIRACVLLLETSREELPPSYDVSLRLYYNKAAPDGYQAPGYFLPDEHRDHLQVTRHKTIKLGCVETPFHSLTPRTYIKEQHLSYEPSVSSFENLTPVSLTEDDFNVSTTQNSALTSAENRVQCPCNKFDTDDALLTCQVCKTRQHAACFGITCSGAVRLAQHCCTACSDRDPDTQPTDSLLAALSAKRRQCVCVLRRALAWCWRARARRVSAAHFADKLALAPRYADKLLNILHTHQVVYRDPHSNIQSQHQVNVEHLKRVTCLFFSFQDQYSQDTHTSMVPISSSNQSDYSLTDVSFSAEEVLSRVETGTTSSNHKDEHTMESRHEVIAEACSSSVGGSYVNDEEIDSVLRKRKSIGASETGIRAKRAKARRN